MVRIWAGQGWRTIKKPPLSEPTAWPFLSTTSASMVSSGQVALPGLSGSMGVGLIRIMPVSVCHHVSMMGSSLRPICLRYHIQASGLMGSPTVPSRRRLDRSCWAGGSSPKPIRLRMAVGAWIGRGALEENTGGSSHQGAVDNVAVPGHPADISCTPVHVIRLDVKDELGGGIDAHGVAALYMHHTLWLAGTATGVEDIEHVLTVHHFAGHHRVLRHVNEQVIQIVIPPLLHRRSSAQSAYDEHRLHGWCFRHGLISDTLELNRFATAQPPVSGNDQFGIGIVDALTQRAGGKAAEDDGVRGTDAGTG